MMKKWNAVILAGDRGLTDPVAKAANVPGKALAKLGDVTLIERIVRTLNEAECINQIFSVGPSQKNLVNEKNISSMFLDYGVKYLEPDIGPSSSALLGVNTSAFYPTLIVTSDLPLLTVNIVEDYCSRIEDQNVDFVVTAVNYSSINNLLPELKKTQYRFGNQNVCFANIFAVMNATGLKAISYWRDIEKSRKKPLQVIRKIDWWSVLLYKFGCLDIDQASAKLSKKLGASLIIDQCSIPELAVDVDSSHDFQVLSRFVSERQN